MKPIIQVVVDFVYCVHKSFWRTSARWQTNLQELCWRSHQSCFQAVLHVSALCWPKNRSLKSNIMETGKCTSDAGFVTGVHRFLFIYYLFIYTWNQHIKPHKTVYTMDIKRHNVCCWLIGNCRDEPLTQRRKSYNSGKGKTQYKKQTKN